MVRMTNWWAVEIDAAFQGLRESATRLEEQIARLAAADEDRLRAASLDDGERGNALAEHHWLFDEMLPRNLRYAGVMLLLATVESTLLHLCDRLQAKQDLRLTPRDIAGRTHERALRYIRKVGGVALPASSFKATLARLVVVRDCLAHGGGNVELTTCPTPTDIRDAVRHLPGFSVNAAGFIEIAQGACAALIEDASTWIDHILTTGEADFRVETAKRR